MGLDKAEDFVLKTALLQDNASCICRALNSLGLGGQSEGAF
jgi:hypothetical protein